ncbi:MAG: PEP-CTERM sorting domain-containing protein [Pirellulales bacterium]
MMSHFVVSSARDFRTRIGAPWSFVCSIAPLALVFVGIESAQAAPIFSVGARETIYKASQPGGLKYWPDGNFGVVSNGNGTYDFYAANSSKSALVTGTLENPAQGKKKKVKIYNVPKKTYGYVAGGPVYEDEATGARFMVYHAEIHKKGKYSSVLGLAASTDPNGQAFWDLGTIIEPNMPVGQAPWSVDVGGGSFAIHDGYFNVYYRDYMANATSSELAVARAPLADLVSNSLNGISTPFTKYYNGNWSEPGRGGKSSPLETGNPANWWSSVSYNEYLDQLVLVSSQWQSGGTGPDLYLATSADGVNWSARQPFVLDAGEQMYPTIIGTGPDPQRTGQSFYVYYTDGKRWGKAQLARRLVTFDSMYDSPSVLPEPGSGSDLEWASVSDFHSDFQSGGPATGWTYAWNPNGKLGDSASFGSLQWSDVAQAYNTTGAATTVPGTKTHIDDYLQLTATGGHPGQPKYMPIAGYTIQADDGAGLYRIADSSIQKIDGNISTLEDGLQVLVYVNNALSGSAAGVSTNGQLMNFNRELGQLNVGDTVWVMVNPLQSHYYDSFTSFDFSIQKSVPLAMMSLMGSGMMSVAVPEPSTLLVLSLALVCYGCGQRRRN